MLTMIHNNHARLESGTIKIDRKFHVGMLTYLEHIRAPIVSIHPDMPEGAGTMDPITVPLSSLGYDVITVKRNRWGKLIESDMLRLQKQVARSRLLYGSGMGSYRIAHKLGIPYVTMAECDLKTQIVVTSTQTSSSLRKIVRSARCIVNYGIQVVPNVRHAISVHCNGYPVYDELGRFNSNRLLYLDSRMSADLVISKDELNSRLAEAPSRSLRLLYSGRYEPLKGAVDAVRVGLECLRRGFDLEMHCYGQGSQYGEMKRLASQDAARGRIYVHDAISYPELVRRSRSFDIFVCCHIQNDPSCTYLESFGAGLPIVGYGNAMWRRLSKESQAGFSSRLGKPVEVANDIERLSRNQSELKAMSHKAREFAIEHCFEREFRRRTDDLNSILEDASYRRQASA